MLSWASSARLSTWLAWTFVVAYSWAPFDFVDSASAEAARGSSTNVSGWLDLLLHGAAFIGVGAVSQFDRHATRQTCLDAFITAAAGLFLCLIVECGQLFLPSRHPDLTEFAINTSGFLLGVVCAYRFGRAHSDVGVRSPTLSRLPCRGLLLAWAVAWSAIAALPWLSVGLEDWSIDFPLLIGDETNRIDEEGPWRGHLRYLGIYDRALSDRDVQLLGSAPPGSAHSSVVRSDMGLLVGYDFSEPQQFQVIPRGRLASEALTLQVPGNAKWTAGGPHALILDGRNGVSTSGPAEAITAALKVTDSFSVEAWCRSSDLSQTGPARIVGISNGLWERNFTLAQEKDQVYFRVRNRLNGINGLRHELRARKAITEKSTHLIATYRNGHSRLFVDAVLQEEEVDLRQPGVILGLGPTWKGTMAAALLAVFTVALIGSLCHPLADTPRAQVGCDPT